MHLIIKQLLFGFLCGIYVNKYISKGNWAITWRVILIGVIWAFYEVAKALGSL